MEKKTLVVSAFPACGKSYLYNKYKNSKLILDSDSSEFSWIKNANGDNTTNRDPAFPLNYIKHIQENVGKADIIFVSSHLIVREAMEAAEIDYITVYPEKSLKQEWINRCVNRGNNDAFISFIDKNWDSFMDSIITEPHGKSLKIIGSGLYLEDVIKPWLEGD